MYGRVHFNETELKRGRILIDRQPDMDLVLDSGETITTQATRRCFAVTAVVKRQGWLARTFEWWPFGRSQWIDVREIREETVKSFYGVPPVPMEPETSDVKIVTDIEKKAETKQSSIPEFDVVSNAIANEATLHLERGVPDELKIALIEKLGRFKGEAMTAQMLYRIKCEVHKVLQYWFQTEELRRNPLDPTKWIFELLG